MLDIYPTLEGMRSAKGMLYMDDGETFNEEHTIIHFTYEDGKFSITNSNDTYREG